MVDPGEEPAEPSPSRPGRRRVVWWFIQAAFVALAIRLLIPQLSSIESTSRQVLLALPLVGVTVILLELACLLCYAELVRSNLRAMDADAPRGLVYLSTLVGNALGRILPGGTSAALAVQADSLGGAGLDTTSVVAGLAASGLVSSLTLALLFPIAAVLALIGGQAGSIALGALGVALVLVVAAVSARPALRRAEAVGRFATRTLERVPFGWLRRAVHPERTGAVVTDFLENMAGLIEDRGALVRGGGWAASNWLLDFAVVVVMAVTVGHGTPLWGLLLAYIVAQLTMAIPVTPGGIGTVELAMTTALVATGAPAAAATSTVLGWRLVSQWLAILWGLPLLPVLRHRSRREAATRAATGERDGNMLSPGSPDGDNDDQTPAG